MSESDGLLKLTEYLKQTRRQAEFAIDTLNKQIEHLTNENKDLKQLIKQIEAEKSEYKRLFEQLKQETSGKWKFKERDDWKCLVDNIQQDRNRLQEENSQLNAVLSTASQQIVQLKEEIEKLYLHKDELEELNRTLQGQINSFHSKRDAGSSSGELSVSTDRSTHDLVEQLAVTAPILSPIVDKTTGRRIFSFDSSVSPQSIAQQLKEELMKAHGQIEEERRKADMEKSRQLAEINRLKLTINDIAITQKRQQTNQIAEVRVIHQRPSKIDSSRGHWLFGSWFGGVLSATSSSGSEINVLDPIATTAILKV